MIGRLHKNGIVHGDLTTSNMILTPHGKVVFVDFGLSERSIELEPKGVDLHLMKRTLNSTHHRYAKACFEAVMGGYAESVGGEEARKVALKIREIERRGRYVADRDK
jgi:TP53 regulating kinase-like protein